MQIQGFVSSSQAAVFSTPGLPSLVGDRQVVAVSDSIDKHWFREMQKGKTRGMTVCFGIEATLDHPGDLRIRQVGERT